MKTNKFSGAVRQLLGQVFATFSTVLRSLHCTLWWVHGVRARGSRCRWIAKTVCETTELWPPLSVCGSGSGCVSVSLHHSCYMLSTVTIIYLQVWRYIYIYLHTEKTRLSVTPGHCTVQEGLSMVSCREGITKSKHVLYWKLFTPNLCPWGLDWFLLNCRNQSSRPGRPWGFCKGLPGRLDWFLQFSRNHSSQPCRPWQRPQGENLE